MQIITIDEINKLVGLQLGKKNVHEQDRFMEDLGAESADIANLVATAEEKYKITIKESEIARLITPADLFALIQQRTQ